MPRHPAPVCWMACVAVLLGVTAPGLHAGSAPPAEPGYHDVTVQTGGKPTVIRVQDTPGPRLHGQLPEDGNYNPENMDLSRTSPMANKAFSTGPSPLSKSDQAQEAGTANRFITKSFMDSKPDTTSDFGRTYKTSSFAGSFHGNGDFGKSFATSASKMTQDKDSPFSSKTSSFQNQTAVLGGSKNAPFSGNSNLADKTFADPDLTHIKRDPYAAANGLDVKRMVDLPNRPLTIDEVRNLINHEQIPDLGSKPDAPSKALNDPGWEPPTVAPFPHEKPAPLPPEEKDNGLPSPGMMADPPPENAEPLPK